MYCLRVIEVKDYEILVVHNATGKTRVLLKDEWGIMLALDPSHELLTKQTNKDNYFCFLSLLLQETSSVS